MLKNSVFHFSPCYVDFSRDLGGISNAIREIARCQEKKVNVFILCSVMESKKKRINPCIMNHGNVTVFAIDYFSFSLLLKFLFVFLRQIKSGGCYIHLHGFFSLISDFLAIALAKIFSIKLLITPHGRFSLHQLRNKFYLKKIWLFIFLTLCGKKGVALTFFTPEESYSSIKIDYPTFYVLNGAVKNSFSASSIKKDYFIFLGRVVESKNVFFLIDAFSLSNASKKHYLMFSGPVEEDLKEKLECHALERGVEIKFSGSVSGEVKDLILSEARLLLLPSLSEGFPLTLAEAVVAGTPTIFSQACNAKFISCAGAGYEMIDFNPTKWGEIIDTSISSDNYYSLIQSCKKLSSSFDWDTISLKYMEIGYDLSSYSHKK